MESSSQKHNNSVVHERVISTFASQNGASFGTSNELTNLEDSHNSGEIIQTGTGTILVFQQKTHHSSSNEVLSERNLLSNDTEEGILVKDYGILPGVDGLKISSFYLRLTTYNPKTSSKPPIRLKNSS